MTPVIIICITIFILFTLSLFVTKGLVDKYLNIRKDTYKDMDVLHSKRLETMEGITDWLTKSYNRGEIVSAKITEEISALRKEIASLIELKDDVSSIKGKIATQTVGNTFMPRRK